MSPSAYPSRRTKTSIAAALACLALAAACTQGVVGWLFGDPGEGAAMGGRHATPRPTQAARQIAGAAFR
jgi:hypothetical protein